MLQLFLTFNKGCHTLPPIFTEQDLGKNKSLVKLAFSDKRKIIVKAGHYIMYNIYYEFPQT